MTKKEQAVHDAIKLLTKSGIKAQLGVTWCSGDQFLMIVLADSELQQLLKDCIQKE